MLQATSNAGNGTAAVDYIQRLFIEGGVAPNGGTGDPASDISVGVPLTATDAFYSDGAYVHSSDDEGRLVIRRPLASGDAAGAASLSLRVMLLTGRRS